MLQKGNRVEQERTNKQMIQVNDNELAEINAGWVLEVIVGVTLAAILTDWEEFKKGCQEGYEYVKNQNTK